MNKMLSDGIPLTLHYKKLLKSETFKEMEKFSDKFLLDNNDILREYSNKWVSDPLHQWSRQWEYPFVFSKVQQMILSDPKPSILDAGSGATFFPFFLNTMFDAASIHCCDCDPMLLRIYNEVNLHQKKHIEFSPDDLRSLHFKSDTFHMVYCISVLEHTDHYETIIDEFYRVLLPGGNLVVTFDISLDGTRDIDIEKAGILLSALLKRFNTDKDISIDLQYLLSNPEIFTSLSARKINPDLISCWKKPSFFHHIKSLIDTGRFESWPPPFTVFCLGLTKRPT